MRGACRLCAVGPRACAVHALAASPSIPLWALLPPWLHPAPPMMAIEEKEDDHAADKQTQKQDKYRRPEPRNVEAYHPLFFVDPIFRDDDSDFTNAELLQLEKYLLPSTRRTSTKNTGTSKPSSSRSRSICRICSDTGCTHSVSTERTSDHGREAFLKLANTLNGAADGRPTGEKGKEKLQFRESSWLPIRVKDDDQEEAKFYCGICMEYLPIAEWFGIENCSHIFCAGCVGRYVAAKVAENLIFIRCPEPECQKGVLEPDMCRRIIPREVFDRWGLALAEHAVGAKKFYCPYKDCSRLLIHDGGGGGGGDGSNTGAITNALCPHCRRMFCAQCRVPWHHGIGCEEFRRLGKDERGREELMLTKLAADNRWQRCPQCKIFIEKIYGCMAMTCRCGYCFCYSCGSQLSKAIHFCTKCSH